MLHARSRRTSQSGRLVGADGRYGPARNGETTGSVFRVDLDGNLTVIHQFHGSDGATRGVGSERADGSLRDDRYGGQYRAASFRSTRRRSSPSRACSAIGAGCRRHGPDLAGVGFEAGAAVSVRSVPASTSSSGRKPDRRHAGACRRSGHDVVVTNPDLSRTTRPRAWSSMPPTCLPEISFTRSAVFSERDHRRLATVTA
jgi:hypothetical protein